MTSCHEILYVNPPSNFFLLSIYRYFFSIYFSLQDLDLRLQHFHSFSRTKWGGHYHYDTTPDTIEYEAYFNVAERIVRVDKPKTTHKFGRD